MTTAHAQIVSSRLVVGMEVHIELATRSKMFTRAPNLAHPDHYEALPNSLVDAMVLALPGVLPVMNKSAVEMSMMVGMALGCQISSFSKWDRKNYFYPDLPKGYQISQYDLPLCFDGELNFHGADGALKQVGIIRAHLEEDTGKLGHELPGGGHYEGSLVDLNRAGTPLLEVVTEPDLTSADDAVIFGQELRNICRFLKVTEGIMQRGHMRFEPNINVIIDTADGREYATPIVEVKNLNSFKALKGAIEFEFSRQVEQWKLDGKVQGPGAKSTRGWDDIRGVTVLQREKEDAHDYRYFPEPDLPPLIISEDWKQDVAARVPQLPMQRRKRYQDVYGLSEKDAKALTDEPDVCFLYEACIEATQKIATPKDSATHAGRECAKWLLNAGAKRANERGVRIDELGISPAQIAAIIDLRDRDLIGSSAADELFGLLCEPTHRGVNAHELAKQRGLIQVRDEGQLEEWIADAIRAQPQAADDFRAGKDAAAGRLVGHVMKVSKGQADAKAIQSKLREKLRASS